MNNQVPFTPLFIRPLPPKKSKKEVTPNPPISLHGDPASFSELLQSMSRPTPTDLNEVPDSGSGVLGTSFSGMGLTPNQQRDLYEQQAQGMRGNIDPNAATAIPAKAQLDYITHMQQMRDKLGPPHPQDPYSMPPPIARTVPELPGRTPLPRNQGADIATAALSILFPQMAGRFAGSNYGSATDEQGRQAQYAHQKYLADTRNADIAYGDQSQYREEGIHNDLLNRAIAQKNAESKYGFDTSTGELGADAARQQSLLDALGLNTTAQQAYGGAALQATQAQRKVDENNTLRNALITQGNKFDTALLGAGQRDLANREAIQGRKETNEATNNRSLYNAFQSALERAGRQGQTLTPGTVGSNGVPMIPPTITPQRPDQFSPKLKSDMALKAAQAALATKHVSYVGVQVDNARKGKPVDITKATPEERIAIQALTGSRNAYLSTKKAWTDYSNKIQTQGLDPKDKAIHGQWNALRLQTEQAANDFNNAHANAISIAKARNPGTSAPAQTAPATSIQRVKSVAEAMKLKSGTQFYDPNGVLRVR